MTDGTRYLSRTVRRRRSDSSTTNALPASSRLMARGMPMTVSGSHVPPFRSKTCPSIIGYFRRRRPVGPRFLAVDTRYYTFFHGARKYDHKRTFDNRMAQYGIVPRP